jgi:hypothetical protein
MKRLYLFPCVLVALALVAAPAFAQSETEVVIKYGELLSQLSGTLITLAGSALAAALAMLPPAINSLIKTWRVDQLMENAISYGINRVAEAAHGKELKADVGYAVLAQALQYAVDNGSPKLIKWIGGLDGVEKKLIARIPLAGGEAISPA